MIENRKLYNGHTYSGALLQACVDGYQQGRADAYEDMVKIKSVVLTRPKFMSVKKYIKYLYETFPEKWLFGWNDSECKTYKLLIPTVKEKE